MKLCLLLLNWASRGTEVPQCSTPSVTLFTLLPLLGWGVVRSPARSAWASPTAFAGVSQAPLWLQGPTLLIGSHASFFPWALNCLRTGPCLFLVGIPSVGAVLHMEDASRVLVDRVHCLCGCPCEGGMHSPSQHSLLVTSRAIEITGVE